MADDRLSVALACYKAYEDKDRAALEALVFDDFHFTSPLDNRLNGSRIFHGVGPTARILRSSSFFMWPKTEITSSSFMKLRLTTVTDLRMRNA